MRVRATRRNTEIKTSKGKNSFSIKAEIKSKKVNFTNLKVRWIFRHSRRRRNILSETSISSDLEDLAIVRMKTTSLEEILALEDLTILEAHRIRVRVSEEEGHRSR